MPLVIVGTAAAGAEQTKRLLPELGADVLSPVPPWVLPLGDTPKQWSETLSTAAVGSSCQHLAKQIVGEGKDHLDGEGLVEWDLPNMPERDPAGIRLSVVMVLLARDSESIEQPGTLLLRSR